MIASSSTVLLLSLTPREVLEYMELWKVHLSLWEKQVIFSLDDNVVPILNMSGKNSENTISVKDTGALLASYRAASAKGKNN